MTSPLPLFSTPGLHLRQDGLTPMLMRSCVVGGGADHRAQGPQGVIVLVTVELERTECHVVAGLAVRLLKGVPGYEIRYRGDASHERPAPPLAAFATEDGGLRPPRR